MANSTFREVHRWTRHILFNIFFHNLLLSVLVLLCIHTLSRCSHRRKQIERMNTKNECGGECEIKDWGSNKNDSIKYNDDVILSFIINIGFVVLPRANGAPLCFAHCICLPCQLHGNRAPSLAIAFDGRRCKIEVKLRASRQSRVDNGTQVAWWIGFLWSGALWSRVSLHAHGVDDGKLPNVESRNGDHLNERQLCSSDRQIRSGPFRSFVQDEIHVNGDAQRNILHEITHQRFNEWLKIDGHSICMRILRAGPVYIPTVCILHRS